MNINSSLQKTPIAVIGLSALFADARNIEEFWTNIVEGKDSITDVPDSRWSIDDYYDADMSAPDKTYCKRGGFLPEIDFNPMEFGLPPNILEVTDVSQLLALVAARDALADAGYGVKSPKFTAEVKEKTGVLLGVGGGQKLITPLIARLQYPIWERALRSSGVAEEDIPNIVDKMKKAYVGWNENSFPGLLGNVISGRITNRFDLGGINSVVDAACAASLSAIKMALSELIEGRADMMLTGGVDTDNSPFMYMSFSKTPAFSKSGNISPFSDKADGMLIGEGVGMLVLKRLSDAERDGDRVYAVIKGVGTSSDGRFKSVYAPRPAGQALAMNRAYKDAGYAPSTVGLIEAHGTGTGAGDPTEFTSMQMVFGADNPQKQHIALGSVKSQIGHTKAAAGAAGMVKAVLALHHKILPPTINVEQPNSKFDITNSAIYINTEARPWIRNGHPRRASVSAFGFGGINVHLALEEYKGASATNYRLHQPHKSILLAEKNPDALLAQCQKQLDLLKSNPETGLQDLLQLSQKSTPEASFARLGFVISDYTQCVSYLSTAVETLKNNTEAWDHPKGIYFRPIGIALANHKVAALFSGQGSQYVGMGQSSANAFPKISEAFQQLDQIFYDSDEQALSKVVFPIPVFSDEERKNQELNLRKTQFAQPAIGALSMGQYNVFHESGFQPDFVAGHSFGELTALWAAGAYDAATFLALAKARGQAMSANSGDQPSTMMAVKASAEKVQDIIASIPGVKIANINSNNQVVIGGNLGSIQRAKESLTEAGLSVIPLPVSAAFHTEEVKHAQIPFANFLAKQHIVTPVIPVFANSTGKPYPSNVVDLKRTLGDQILNPVLFKEQIENMYAQGAQVFVEFGPKGVLTNLVKEILESKDHTVIAINPKAGIDSDLQLRQAALQMQVVGIKLSNIDPFKREFSTGSPLTKLNVKLSGNNYVSEPTQKAYTDVLNNGIKISSGSSKVIERIVEVEKIVEVPVSNNTTIQIEKEEEIMNKEVLQLLQSTLETFKSNQTKSLEIFERFMTDQNSQAQQLLQILSNQVSGDSPLSSGAGSPSGTIIKVAPTPSETPYHSNGNVTSNGNGNGNVVTKTAPSPVMTAPLVATSTTVAATAVPVAGNNKLEELLLEVVSEKTGYPAEMLELEMDLEADLGIDSIKRVEIFGALTQQYPEMAGINPNELTELRTLGEIVSYVSNAGGATIATAPQSAPAPSPTVPNDNAVEGTAEVKDNSALEAMLLEVVSEKTGYPAEMLEMSMDLEADLGIDSIKRVEIFGALTQQYPEMAGINPNELTELRTLGEIVSYVGKAGQSPALATPGIPDPVATDTPAPDSKELEKILLEVVSEKTGYPAEMLELGMDLEADLGIDSIKRVEIFGSLTQQYPEMAGINPNELTELRTLGEIVNYVGAVGKKKS